MACTTHVNAARGFALIEVMIAVVVLAAGLLALTALQGAIIRSSAESKVRSQLAAYAQSEMDRLRVGGVDALDVGTADFTIPGDFAGVGSLAKRITVVQYVADPATGAFVENAADPDNNAYFRRVTLALSWSDASNSSRTLTFATDISPLALNASKVMVDRAPPEDSGLMPIVRRVSPLTEGMIPIATGGADGEQTAATNPKPKLVGGERKTYVADTRFDVLTFSADPYTPDGFAKLNKKIETAVVGCTCQNSTAGFGSDRYSSFAASKAYRPTYWEGAGYSEPRQAASSVTSSPMAVSQSELCDVCCRDHKDPATEQGPKFSPWPGQQSAHYRAGSTGILVEAGSGETYLEACRVIRVSGVWRVAADPKVQDIALVATQASPPSTTSGSSLPSVSNNDAATSPRLSTPGTTAYEAYVYGQVNSMFFSTAAIPAEGNALSAQSAELNQPQYVPMLPAGDRRWLHARALITDYLESQARDRLRNASSDCTSATSVGRAQCLLPFLPMATTNATEIAAWMPRAKTAADTVPASLATLDPNYLNYARAYLNRYNSGLALVGAINPNDGQNPARDEQLLVKLSSSAPTSPVWMAVPSPNPNTARYFGDPLLPMRGYAETAAPIPFTLNWNFATSSNLGSPVTDNNKNNDPTAFVVGSASCNYNQANSTSNPYACMSAETDNFGVQLAGFNRIDDSARVDNPCGTGKVKKPVCVIYSFNGATVNSPTSSISAASALLVGGTSGKLDEVIQITIPRVNVSEQSTVTVNFQLGAIQQPTYTCSTAGDPIWTLPCQ